MLLHRFGIQYCAALRAQPSLHEVYVSRIPINVAAQIKKDPMAVTGVLCDQNITFRCFFCQEELSKKKYNWKLHLASHTGEYRYKCNNCTIKSLTPCTSAHDTECTGPSMEVINEVMFEENHIFAFMCRVCNFVQLSQANMDTHLKEEHGRVFSTKGTLQFSILNYAHEETVEQSRSSETLESDISMPELTPQPRCENNTSMSAFIPSASDEIESLRVLNDRSFVSPSKPSIIDKLKQNFDEIMRKDAEKKTPEANEKPDDEWEDIVSPAKEAQKKKPYAREVLKAKRSLAGSTSATDDVLMPAPLALKEEEVDIFEGKKLVANIAYNIIQGQTWYLCAIGDCKHATLVRAEMYCHVREQHSSIVWDGFCYLCTAQIIDDETCELTKEVKHMAVVHIKDRSAFDELIASPSRSNLPTTAADGSTIKLRRFSGDKLSIETPVDEPAIKHKFSAPCSKIIFYQSLAPVKRIVTS